MMSISIERKKYLRAWRLRNRERLNEQQRIRRRLNPQKTVEACRKWRLKHKRHMRQYWREYKQRPEQIAYNKEYWRKNKKRLSKLFKNYSQKNPHIIRKAGYRYFKKHRTLVHKRNKIYRQTHVDRVLFWIRRRRVAHLKAVGSHTLQEWLQLRRKTRGICPCCKEYVGLTRLTLDHIVPISKGGSNYIWNIQPLCKKCNSSKGARHYKKY